MSLNRYYLAILNNVSLIIVDLSLGSLSLQRDTEGVVGATP